MLRTPAAARLAAACLALLASACASTLGPEDALHALRRDARELTDGSSETAYVPVLADSAEDARGRIVRARTGRRLDESRVLAATFEPAAREAVEVVVGGPYPALVEQVLLDALAQTPQPRLPGLRVVVISRDAPSAALQQALEASEAAWVHGVWQAPEPD
jgi:hypothetical protein